MTKTELIGCWGKQGESDSKLFQYSLKIGDIVLIRTGKKPIALVEVIGEYEYTDQVNKDLDWFQCRRKEK